MVGSEGVRMRAKIEYVDSPISCYDPEKDIIFLSKKLLKNKKAHNIILAHEIEHYKAKKNYAKQFYIDLKTIFNFKFNKALKTCYEPRDFFLDVFPIRKYHDGYHFNLSVTILWILILIAICYNLMVFL